MKKGRKSVKFSWVKGHATELHIIRGITTKINKEGNDKADEIADMGTALHGKDVMDIAEWLRNKHASYTNLIIDIIIKSIIESYMIHRALITKYDNSKIESKDLTKYVKLDCSRSEDCVDIQRTHTLMNYQKYGKTCSAAIDVEKFLAEAKITKEDVNTRHITWLELNILFRTRGGKHHTRPNEKMPRTSYTR